MAAARYLWRQLNQKQREELLAWRKERDYPWHSPQHRPNFGHLRFLISAACYEHRHYIGYSLERMDSFSRDLLAVLATHASQTFAWCVLPNHYHALVETPKIKQLLHEFGTASWPHFALLEWRGANSQTESILSRCRAHDAFRTTLLGNLELRPSQSCSTRVRGTIEGLAMEQRYGISSGNRSGGSETCLARISGARLRRRLGRPRNVT